ncbi:MAG TPA: glycoside hydrolase family 2 protein [Clostridiales bacterium]|nr:glycoside hydrolase family 2 protein [Clostridiales bacterium]
MRKYDFNENWLVYEIKNPNKIKKVTLPHDAMIYEERSMDSLGGKHIAWHRGGDYVYEKTFFAPEDYKDKIIILEFEGAYKDAEVYINDTKVMYRPYGYTNFYVDVTKHLKIGQDNTLKVTVINSDQPNSRWYSGSGIYRPVNLYILPPKHVKLNGLKIKTLDYEMPKIEIMVDTNAPGAMEIQVLDDEKILYSTTRKTNGDPIKINAELPNASLWDIDNPKLYVCKVNFEGGQFQTRFGIRTIECDSRDGFRLNGRRVLLLGACIHHDNGLLGAVAHPFAEYRKIKLLKQAGYNAIRSAHNPCSKALLDACDELGMLVLDEYVDMWYIHKNKYDYADKMLDWWRQDLKDMVDKDYNHPSVIMYSIGNEVAETSQKKGIELCEKMTKYLKSLDYRPVTCGINIFFNYLYSLGFGVYTDKKAEKALKRKKHKAVGSEFFNNLAGKLGDTTMKLGATLRGSDRKTRDAFQKLDVAGYNYGILRYKKDLKKYPNRVILGTETFCKDAGLFYDLAKQNPALIGDFVWAGMDYLGEVGVGAWVHQCHAKDFSYGVGWMSAGSGRLDLTGKPTAETAYTKVAFEQDNIRIAAQPVHCSGIKTSPSAWKMSDTIESWNYPGYEGKKTIVEVYSRAPKVALYINDKKIGEKRPNKNYVAYFKTRYYSGVLTAIGLDQDGKELYRSSLHSGDEQTVLRLEPEQAQITQKDLAYVRVRFTDSNGLLKPYIHNSVKLIVENGTLLAFGNGCPFNERGYLTDTAETYFGEALAIIRPNEKGTISVFGGSELGTAKTEIKVL